MNLNHCQYQQENVRHCCDSFNSLPDEFQGACSDLGGQSFGGACEVLNLPWLPESEPGSWRGACAIIAPEPGKVWPEIIRDDVGDGKAPEHDLHDTTDHEKKKKQASKERHARGTHDHNIDGKRSEKNHHHDHHDLPHTS